ncbi:MAG: tagaturonate epimerase family protein [Verrucomicrobiota bacterium]
MLMLEKLSFGVGDRFAQQAKAQLRAFQLAATRGVDITPVWNKSNREHLTVNSEPGSVRSAAEAVVRESGWSKRWHVDADHIRLETVGRFLSSSDFFTIDVADNIGKAPLDADVRDFVTAHPELIGRLKIPGISEEVSVTSDFLEKIARKYLAAVKEAGRIYRRIRSEKNGHGNEDEFITEVSMDETESPQTPPELLIILAAIADEKIPIQTIAPKFTGRFNKGVDYVGSVAQFEKEFNDDIAIITFAVGRYGLPKNLKLSVHSGSDKFSIYPAISRALRKSGAGVHIKTAGTTWLEEVIGLAESGGAALELAKEIYQEAYAHRDELCAPYASVIDIQTDRLPTVERVQEWHAEQFVSALRHNPVDPRFNPDVRQLLHVAYKVASKMGERYLALLRENEEVVARNVTENLFDRHLKPLFLD